MLQNSEWYFYHLSLNKLLKEKDGLSTAIEVPQEKVHHFSCHTRECETANLWLEFQLLTEISKKFSLLERRSGSYVLGPFSPPTYKRKKSFSSFKPLGRQPPAYAEGKQEGLGAETNWKSILPGNPESNIAFQTVLDLQ